MIDQQAPSSLIPARARLSFVAGIPSFRSYYVAYLASEVLRRCYGSVDTIGFASTSDDIVERIEGAGAKVLFCDLPNRDAVSFALGTNEPILFVEEDLVVAARQFMKSRGCGARDAAIVMSQCYAALTPLREGSQAVAIAFDQSESAADVAEMVAKALKISPEQWASVRRAFVKECRLERPAAEAIIEFSLSIIVIEDEPGDDEEALLSQLETAFQFATDGALDRLTVPLAMLHGGPPLHAPVGDDIDLTGPARCLSFGPYLRLPEGPWEVRFEFMSWGNDSHNTLEFDAVENGFVVGGQTVNLVESGHFSVSFLFAVNDRMAALELRSHLSVGAINGGFKLIAVEVCSARHF